MVFRKSKIWLALGMLAILASACGKSENQAENRPNGGAGGGEIAETGSEGTADENSVDAEDEITLHFDYYMKTGEVERVYEPREYTDETGNIIRIFFKTPVYHNVIDEWGYIEDEVNWHLKEEGYDFSVEFVFQDDEDWWYILDSQLPPSEGIKRVDGPVDLYITYDYAEGARQGEFMELTDLAEEEDIRSCYDEIVWEQFLYEGRIYGIPVFPVATHRMAYFYNPQLMEKLGLNISDFHGNLDYFLQQAEELKEKHICPLKIYSPLDCLNAGILGYEVCDDIIVIKHSDGEIKAVNPWEEEALLAYYHQLGELRQLDGLLYDPGYIESIESLSDEEHQAEYDREALYKYVLMTQRQAYDIPGGEEVNECEEVFRVELTGEDISGYAQGGSYVKSETYVPEVPAYIYEKQKLALVMAGDTEYYDECCDIIRLYLTDPEFQLLLGMGIEGYNYEIKDDVLTLGSNKGIDEAYLDYTRRYWPVEDVVDFYDEEIQKLNHQVEFASEIDVDWEGYEETYEACKEIIEENQLVFLGYYGDETDKKLEEVEKELMKAGYQELIGYVNSRIGM